MLFDTETSVRCLLDVIGRATQQQSGQLLGWDGAPIEW